MPVHPNRGAIGRAAVIAGVVALLLGACVPTEPIAVVTPSATPAPVFATDAEALAAAEKAYAAYLAMSDLIAQEGGRDPERIAPFVTEEQLVEELEGYSLYISNGWHTAGRSSFFGVVLQSSFSQSGQNHVVIYACTDNSGVQVINADGLLVRSNVDVPSMQLELDFSTSFGNSDLVLSATRPTGGDDSCTSQ